MIELVSRSDIEKISLDLLRQSKSIDVFPTPIDKLVSYSELVVNKEVDLGNVEETFFSKTSQSLVDLMKKVRGFLDRRQKVIYLDLTQSVTRQNFVKLHETGHGILPWQRQTMEFLDDDATLDPLTNEEFEAEANYFASITLFQQERFDAEISQLPLSLETVTYLSKRFGASVHATFRRYVERSNKRCALLVLQNISTLGQKPNCEPRDYFHSETFLEDFGNLNWNNNLGYKWLFVQDYYHGKRFKTNGEIKLDTKDGQVEFNYHFFNNSYNAFVFFFPKGERIKSRTKFIIAEA